MTFSLLAARSGGRVGVELLLLAVLTPRAGALDWHSHVRAALVAAPPDRVGRLLRPLAIGGDGRARLQRPLAFLCCAALRLNGTHASGVRFPGFVLLDGDPHFIVRGLPS